MKPPRYEVVDETHNTFIRDTKNGLNFCVLCESGFGLSSSTRDLASNIVIFLNSLPPEETLLMGELEYKCPACEGDITSPHMANCNYANGN